MIYHWWNRGVSWGSNNSQIKGIQTSDPNLNPNSVKLKFELGLSWGLSWRSSWRSLNHPIGLVAVDERGQMFSFVAFGRAPAEGCFESFDTFAADFR